LTQNRQRNGRGGLFGTGRQLGALRQTAIQPAGIPTMPHVQPQRYEVGSNLTKLAQSLSTLNTGLNALAGVNAREKADPASQANKEWIAKRQQMSLEELRQEALNNTADGQLVRQDALNVLLAEKTSAAFRRKVSEFYHTEFDKTAGDWNSEYARLEQEFASSLGDNDLAKGAFFELNKGFRETMFAQDQTQKIDYTKQQIGSAITDSLRNAIEDASLGGKSPQEFASIIFNKAASMGDFMTLSPQERDETIFQLAQEYALQGREDVVRTLLESERGEIGQPLMKVYPNQALKLINQALEQGVKEEEAKNWKDLYSFMKLVDNGELTPEHAAQFEASRQVTPQQFAKGLAQSDANREALLARKVQEDASREAKQTHDRAWTQLQWAAYAALERVGGIKDIEDSYIPNEKGTGVKQISSEELVKVTIARKEAEWREWEEAQIAQGGDEAQILKTSNQMRFKWYASNNIVNEKWARQLNGIASRLTTMDFSKQDDALVEHGLQVARLYRDLKSSNPAYLDSLMSDKTAREFLDYHADAMEDEGMGEKAALLAASQHIGLPDSEKLKRRLTPQDLEDVVLHVAKKFGLDERSHHIIESKARQLGERGGADNETLKSKLVKDFERSTVVYNGVPIFNHRDLPPDFLPLLDTIIQERFTQYGQEYGLERADDLYVERDSSGSHFVVKSKSLGGMLVGAQPIDAQTLLEVRKQKEQKRLAAYQAQIAKRDKRQAAIDKVKALQSQALQRQALEREFNETQAQMIRFPQGWVKASLQEKLDKLHDELLTFEAQDLIRKGATPDTPEWKQWRANHGRDVRALEEIWREQQQTKKEKK